MSFNLNINSNGSESINQNNIPSINLNSSQNSIDTVVDQLSQSVLKSESVTSPVPSMCKCLKHSIYLGDDFKYVGPMVNGVFEGHGKMIWKNGNIFEGEFRNGKPVYPHTFSPS
jgi:hypothetical protein